MAECFFCHSLMPDDARQCPQCGASTNREAPDREEDTRANNADDPTERPGEPASDFERQVLAIFREKGKIQAIKIYREQKGAGLKEAKEAVENLAARHGVARPASSGCAGVVLAMIGVIVVTCLVLH